MKKGVKILIGVVVVAGIGAAALFSIQKAMSQSSSTASGQSIIGNKNGVYVNTEKVRRGDVVSKISAKGYLSEIDKKNLYVEGSYKIDKILVEVNDRIKIGQQLYEVDTSDLETRLEQLVLSKETQRLTLEKLQISSGAQETGAYVNAVNSAQISVDTASAALTDTRKAMERSRELFETGIIPQADLEASERGVREAEAVVKSSQQSLKSAQDNLNEIRNNNSKISKSTQLDIETQTVNIRNTENQITDLERQIREAHDGVYSEAEGLLTAIGLMEGVMPTAAVTAFTIIDDSRLEAIVQIGQYNYSKVKIGQSVAVTGDSIEDGTITGKILSMNPYAVREMTGSASEQTYIEAKVEITDRGEGMIPGMSVTCEITINESLGTLLLPLHVMDTDINGRSFVYVVDKVNNTMAQRYIEIGNYSDMEIEVLSGLEENEEYISDTPQLSFADGVGIRYLSDAAEPVDNASSAEDGAGGEAR